MTRTPFADLLRAMPNWRCRASRSAWIRGAVDWLIHGSGAVCPYHDTRTAGGSVTFARGFRRAWFEGRDAAKAVTTDNGLLAGTPAALELADKLDATRRACPKSGAKKI